MHHVSYMYMSFIFACFFVCVHFSSVSICPLCFLLWAASYDGLVPSRQPAIVTIDVYVMYIYLANKLSLSLCDDGDYGGIIKQS